MTPVVAHTECGIASSGSMVILLGPWMPMRLTADGYDECAAAPVTLAERSTPAVSLAERATTPVTLAEGGI